MIREIALRVLSMLLLALCVDVFILVLFPEVGVHVRGAVFATVSVAMGIALCRDSQRQ